MSRLRIAINTTCAVAGGAVTYLQHLLPAMAPHVGRDEILTIGDAATREILSPPAFVQWIETPPLHGGFAQRLVRENFVLPRQLRSVRADVLFHPGNFCVFRADVPQAILIHNLAPFMPWLIAEESLFQRIRLPMLRRLTQSSLDRVASAIFISNWGLRLVVGDRAVDDRRMPVIPFGSEHATVEPSQDAFDQWSLKPDEYVLTASHLYRYKKIEKLIDAWVALGDSVSAWPLLVVGEPFDREYSRRMKDRAALAKSRVIFTGRLDGGTLANLMQSARAFVFTSEAENLPITLLEAMAAGCPIIANRHCSMPETCGDAVLYADPASAATYRQELGRILWDDELRGEMRRRALQRASRFRWGDAARKTLEVLRYAASDGSASGERMIGAARDGTSNGTA